MVHMHRRPYKVSGSDDHVRLQIAHPERLIQPHVDENSKLPHASVGNALRSQMISFTLKHCPLKDYTTTKLLLT